MASSLTTRSKQYQVKLDHLYARSEDKFELRRDILNRPIHNYEDLQCPDPMELKSDVHCYLICQAYLHMR